MAGLDLAVLKTLTAARDPAVVPVLRTLAAQLTALADDIERGPVVVPEVDAVGCVGDRVLMTVAGPDGRIRMSVDTHPEVCP